MAAAAGGALGDDGRAAAFAALLDEAPLGIAVLDRDLRYLAVNELLAAVNGVPAAEHVGRHVREVIPTMRADLEDALRRVLDSGIALRGLQVESVGPTTPGLPRAFELSFLPITGGLLCVVQERTDQTRAIDVLRTSERRYRSLVEATTSLVWTVVPGQGVHTDWLEQIDPIDQHRITDEWLACQADGRTFEVATRIRTVSGWRDVVVRAVPIIEAGVIREWVGASTDVTTARRVEREREAAAARTAGLGRVASSLTEAMQEDDVARVVLDNAIGVLGATGGAITLFEADRQALRFAAVAWPEEQARRRVAASALDLDRPASRVARTKEPMFFVDAADLSAQFPAVADLVHEIGDEAMCTVPLLVNGECLGTLTLSWDEARAFPDDDRLFLLTLADTCAQAIERARLREREHRVAETLQRALLPERLADRAGIRSAACYLPGTEGVAVGGDWYDLFDLGDARVGIVLGDVAGRGVAAAAVMGRLRNALRAYATSIDGPAAVLAAVDDFAARFGSDDLATIVYAVLDTGTGELRYSSAGHLPPLARAADGRVGYLGGEPDLPVGVSEPAPRTEHRVRLSNRSTLVFYSDGLVEDRVRSIEEGLDQLAEVALTTHDASAEATCDALVHGLVGDTGSVDDVAVLVLAWDGPPTADRCSTVLPPVVASARRARALVTEQLEAWGLADLVETAQLCVSEVVTNAVVHAGTPVQLDIARLADRVRVEVADGGAAPPERVDADDEDVHGRGIAIVELLSAGWGVDQLDDGKCVWFELTTSAAS
jgi:PAS domain-containing protein/anti-sigma regulatory factor (Ser/Thr protein kinase)